MEIDDATEEGLANGVEVFGLSASLASNGTSSIELPPYSKFLC